MMFFFEFSKMHINIIVSEVLVGIFFSESFQSNQLILMNQLLIEPQFYPIIFKILFGDQNPFLQKEITGFAVTWMKNLVDKCNQINFFEIQWILSHVKAQIDLVSQNVDFRDFCSVLRTLILRHTIDEENMSHLQGILEKLPPSKQKLLQVLLDRKKKQNN